MLNGYRGLAFVAFAVALVVAFGLGAFVTSLPKTQEHYPSYQTRNNTLGAPDSVANVARSAVKRVPCDNPSNETESDLCAQWRAAKAAEKAADWTLYGVFASCIGITLLLWQLMLTRRAVEDTGEATEAMREQNRISERAQRAWMAHTEISHNFVIDASMGREIPAGVEFQSQWINTGNTPAFHCVFQNQHHFFPKTSSPLPFQTKMNEMSGVTIGPNQTRKSGTHALTEEQFNSWQRADHRLIFLVVVCYYTSDNDADNRINRCITQASYEAFYNGVSPLIDGIRMHSFNYMQFGDYSLMT